MVISNVSKLLVSFLFSTTFTHNFNPYVFLSLLTLYLSFYFDFLFVCVYPRPTCFCFHFLFNLTQTNLNLFWTKNSFVIGCFDLIFIWSSLPSCATSTPYLFSCSTPSCFVSKLYLNFHFAFIFIFVYPHPIIKSPIYVNCNHVV